MNLINIKPYKKDVGQIARDYYLEKERVVGKTVWRKVCLNYYQKNNVDSLLLRTVDPSYDYACRIVDSFFNNEIYTFIGLYTENGNLVAHTRFYPVVKDDGWNIVVGDIFIKNKDSIRSESENSPLKWIYGIYDITLEYIEETFLDQNDQVTRINIISDNKDSDFLEVVQNRGYEIQKSKDLTGERKIFTKFVRERGVARERRNPNQ